MRTVSLCYRPLVQMVFGTDADAICRDDLSDRAELEFLQTLLRTSCRCVQGRRLLEARQFPKQTFQNGLGGDRALKQPGKQIFFEFNRTNLEWILPKFLGAGAMLEELCRLCSIVGSDAGREEAASRIVAVLEAGVGAGSSESLPGGTTGFSEQKTLCDLIGICSGASLPLLAAHLARIVKSGLPDEDESPGVGKKLLRLPLSGGGVGMVGGFPDEFFPTVRGDFFFPNRTFLVQHQHCDCVAPIARQCYKFSPKG